MNQAEKLDSAAVPCFDFNVTRSPATSAAEGVMVALALVFGWQTPVHFR
jgi:hypothetical protein